LSNFWGSYPSAHWHLEDIDAFGAWQLLFQERIALDAVRVDIAVIDDGFYVGHTDLYDRRGLNPEETGPKAKTARDDDRNGLVDDRLGWNFSKRNRNLTGNGPTRHGTAVAGLAVADSLDPEVEPSYPSIGVCPWCRFVPIVRAAGRPGLADALQYAVTRRTRVVVGSISVGEVGDDEVSPLVAELARGGAGPLLVFAAGNDGVTGIRFPASLHGTLAVGAVDCRGRAWRYSHRARVSERLDVVAPSGGLETSARCRLTVLSELDDGQDRFGGTSGAAPIVAGVAGLMLMARPTLKADSIATIIRNTAAPIAGADRTQVGSGLVSACRAVAAALGRDPWTEATCKSTRPEG